MAQLKVDYSDFSLQARWTCNVRYVYNSSGSFSSASCTQSNTENPVTKTVQFDVSDLPEGATVSSVKVHAEHGSGLYGGTFKINDTTPDSSDFVTLSTTDVSSGYVNVTFKWTATRDSTSSHDSQYPTYNGTSSQTVSKSHVSTSNITNVYLLVEYTTDGTGGTTTPSSCSVIYRCVDGELVPYCLYRCVDGVLVPYNIYKCVDGTLVQY